MVEFPHIGYRPKTGRTFRPKMAELSAQNGRILSGMAEFGLNRLVLSEKFDQNSSQTCSKFNCEYFCRNSAIIGGKGITV
jgi:hypothetical protein